MAYEIKDNSGSLFWNDRKESENHPDATGTVKIAGVEYWISAWTKTSANGTRFQSLSFKPKDAARAAPAKPLKPLPEDLDDDIPF